MLPAAARLRRRADFSRIVRSGSRAGRRALVVHVAVDDPGPGAAPARAGFIVSRAVGPAVVRNRVRRRLRHLVRPRLALLPAGTDLVVRATPAAAGASSAELGRQLDSGLAAAARAVRT